MRDKVNHSMTNKKSQVITFDLSSSLIVFLIFIAIFIGLFLLTQASETKQEFELEYIFSNLENNLKFDTPGPSRDFFRDYRINKTKLDNFANYIATGSIDNYVVGEVGGAHGIGLGVDNYDACLYFTDNNNQRISMGNDGRVALGNLSKIPSSCHAIISVNQNPCDKYQQALAFLKPVLFDVGNPEQNRVIQMNLVVCKK
jgi:hypothetical protein